MKWKTAAISRLMSSPATNYEVSGDYIFPDTFKVVILLMIYCVKSLENMDL
jgi:hypothetical protein